MNNRIHLKRQIPRELDNTMGVIYRDINPIFQRGSVPETLLKPGMFVGISIISDSPLKSLGQIPLKI